MGQRITDEIAQDEAGVDPERADVVENGLESRQVGVNVGEEGDPHERDRTRSSDLNVKASRPSQLPAPRRCAHSGREAGPDVTNGPA